MSTLTIVLIVLGVLILWIIILYNGLIRLKNRVQEAWSDIDEPLEGVWKIWNRENDILLYF